MENIGALDNLRVTVLAEDSVLYESPYLGQHGVSFLLECMGSGAKRNILVDVGQNPEALLFNMQKMGVSPSIVDGIVLTHCHYDHTQGLSRILRAIGRDNTEVVAHSDIFRPHFLLEPHFRCVGIMQGDSKPEIENSGGRPCLSREPFTLMPGVTTTGEVKRRTDFEKSPIGLKTIKNGAVVDDPIPDDISVVAGIKGKGLVIITGCSHAGIVNITRQAIEITGCHQIEGIIGGLHLIEASDEVIRKTVDELYRLKVSWISAGHCTGFEAQIELRTAFGEGLSPLHTGMQFNLASAGG
jgi:7,8-dihydropterin-6-yl-methyl-4-(beta-D-ribofuranosyl)aminobenzene 5'-phosphate synthase